MKFKRIGRVLVCLLLVSALLINASPIKAKATGIGATAAITAASTVLSPAGLVVGATFIALGLAAAANPEGFQNMVDAGVSALESAGTWVKDGMVELLRTEDADGNASYYVDSGLMEDVRSWVYDSKVVEVKTLVFNPVYTSPPADALATAQAAPYSFFSHSLYVSGAYAGDYGGYLLCYSYESPIKVTISDPSGNGWRIGCWDSSATIYGYNMYSDSWHSFTGTYSGQNTSMRLIDSFFIGYSDPEEHITSLDVSLGSLPLQSSNLTDGTSARQWSEEYTDRGLKVYGGGSGNNNNDGKWFWKLMLPTTAVTLLAMSQADQWAGETPKEFDDYETKEELKVMDTPEVEFGFGIVLEPDSGDSSGSDDPTESTEPTTPGGIPDIGGGDNPDPGGDGNTGTESGNQTDYTNWFERIIKGIEELPSKFESWITDCKTAIEELPSKFAEWFNPISEKLSSIWETLKTIPQTILDGMRNILSELFVPQEDYISDKVTSLRERFSFADSIMETGRAIGDSLSFGDSEPPVIYIHLDDTEGSYNIGGTVPFLDMRWYARYKPTGDVLLSSLIWVFFAWRCFVHAPNIISGIAGDVEAFNIPDGGGMYLSGSPYAGSDFEKPKRGKFERRKNGRR